MNVFVQLLGWLLITVTFITSFRFAAYLAGPTTSVLYPGLIATTLTIAFVVIVDIIILATGLLVIILPLIVLLRALGVHTYALGPADDRTWRPDWHLPRPSLSTRGNEESQPVTDSITAILDRLNTLLHRLERLILNRPAQDEEDTAYIEFDEDHWNDDP